jgi:hypothetical protein
LVKIVHVANLDVTGLDNYCRPLFSRSLSSGLDPFRSLAAGLSRAGGCTFWSAGRAGFTGFPTWLPAFGWVGCLMVGGGLLLSLAAGLNSEVTGTDWRVSLCAL